MTRRWLTLGVILLLTATMVFAQTAKVGGEARQLSLGGSNLGTGVAINPFITEDPALLLLNPAYQTHYTNYAWWNIGGGTLSGLSTGDNGYNKQNMGVAFGFGKELSIGLLFSYDPSSVNGVASTLKGGTFSSVLPISTPAFIPNTARGVGVTGAQTIPQVANVWEAVLGYRAGSLDLGFGIMYGTSNSKTTASSGANSTEKEASSSMFGFRVGALLDLGSGNMLDARGALRLDKATDNVKLTPVVAGSGGEYSASGTEIELAARLKMRVSNKFSFVPYAQFNSVSAEPKQDAPVNGGTAIAVSEKLTLTGLGLGVGGEYKVSNFLLAGGLSFQMLKAKLEQSSVAPAPPASQTNTFTYTSIPSVNLGAEYQALDWLTLRAGYFRLLGSISQKTETSVGGTGSESEAITSMPFGYTVVGGIGTGTWDGTVTLGLGLRFGAFSLDATVSDEALRRGFGVIGAQDNINTFGYMTASYNFD